MSTSTAADRKIRRDALAALRILEIERVRRLYGAGPYPSKRIMRAVAQGLRDRGF